MLRKLLQKWLQVPKSDKYINKMEWVRDRQMIESFYDQYVGMNTKCNNLIITNKRMFEEWKDVNTRLNILENKLENR